MSTIETAPRRRRWFAKTAQVGPQATNGRTRTTDHLPIAVDAAEAGRLFSISERKWRELHAQGLVPRPVKLGGRVVWIVTDLQAWADAGAPNRHQWEQTRREM